MQNLHKSSVILAILAILPSLVFPQHVYAYTQTVEAATEESIFVNGEKLAMVYDLPEAEERKPTRTMEVSMTAYSSTPDQTDDSPFITANGTRVKDGIVAANFVPFGTKIKIPELYGDKVFTVTDRMNSRYQSRVDIWMNTRQEAIQFGVKRSVTIEIYSE
ncbi:MAG: 3D domain-containing protein [Candidatus Buchananbacteria bacterium]|nr:3D domain-containing protein [Candidatus Buchananbacteria bacterium]